MSNKTFTDAKKHTYSYWGNKPVLKFDELSYQTKSLEILNEREVYSSGESLTLPPKFIWNKINFRNDLTGDNDINKVVNFLKMYYLADTSNKFMLDYSADFIKWALHDGGIIYITDKNDNAQIYGVVGYVIKSVTTFNVATEKFGTIDFLCIHPKYRGKKMVFTLMDECIRHLVHLGCNAGCFTTSKCVPSPISVIRYYHRPLNYKKLFKLDFTRLQNDKDETIKKFTKLFTITEPINNRYIEMNQEHIPVVLELYNKWMARFNIYVNYTHETFKQQFLDNEFVKTYIIMSNDSKNDSFIIDFVSFYLQPYNVYQSDEQIYAAHLFAYTANTESTDEIILNTLKITTNMNMDIFNVTDIMTIGDSLLVRDVPTDGDSDSEDNTKMYEHKFLKGSGKLFFNFFNWTSPRVKSRQINWVTP